VITDSGINWDEGDLIEKAYINFRRARAQPSPTAAPADDLDPAKVFLPTAEELELTGFDCNGDGSSR
jgi:hypothetical protein